MFARPGYAHHRNTATIVPTALLDTDKRTGAVKALKDTLREYRPVHEAPVWSQL